MTDTKVPCACGHFQLLKDSTCLVDGWSHGTVSCVLVEKDKPKYSSPHVKEALEKAQERDRQIERATRLDRPSLIDPCRLPETGWQEKYYETKTNLEKIISRVKSYAVAMDALRITSESVSPHDHSIEQLEKDRLAASAKLADLYRMVIILDEK